MLYYIQCFEFTPFHTLNLELNTWSSFNSVLSTLCLVEKVGSIKRTQLSYGHFHFLSCQSAECKCLNTGCILLLNGSHDRILISRSYTVTSTELYSEDVIRKMCHWLTYWFPFKSKFYR
jgi:hypothetical protein